MDPKNIQKNVTKVLNELFPETSNAKVDYLTGPSVSYVRGQRRQRGPHVDTNELVKLAPKEHRFVYTVSLPIMEDVSIERIIIVVTDDSGNVQDIIESK